LPSDRRWRRCSACKNPIELGATYWVCNVSTCNRKRTGMVFCTVSCWEVHLPVANHRESWAVEKKAPTVLASETPAAGSRSEKREPRRIVTRVASAETGARPPREVLVVASRLKEYVRARSGFNTSDRVLEPLSEIIREVCDRAIQSAERDGRRTVLDRDIPPK